MENCEPVVCTLTSGERAQRGDSWKTALRRAAAEIRECPGGYVVTLQGKELQIAEVERLVEAEKTCCAWMNLEVRRHAAVTLTITADSQEGTEVIKDLLLS